MTIFPQLPKLSKADDKGIATLLEPHLTFVHLCFGYSLMVYVKEGFKTDGASVPEEKLWDSKVAKAICKLIAKHYPGKDYKQTLKYLIGTPFEMPRLLAAIPHDALYGIKWRFRWACDQIYKKILSQCNYDPVRKDIEYAGIRLVGWKNWNKVTKKKKKKLQNFVVAKVIRDKDIQKMTNKLQASEA